MVICSSNTGYLSQWDHKTGDLILAGKINHFAEVTDGEILTFFAIPVTNENKKNENIIVNQIARTELVAVRVDFEFTKFSPKKSGKNSYNFCFTKN